MFDVTAGKYMALAALASRLPSQFCHSRAAAFTAVDRMNRGSFGGLPIQLDRKVDDRSDSFI